MKKVFFHAVLLLMACTVFSQTKKGDMLVGVSFGTLSFTSSNSKTTYSNTPTIYNSDGNSLDIKLTPNAALFIKDNLAVGTGVSLSFYTSKSNSSNTSSTTTSDSKSTQPALYIGPFARYYFSGSSKGMPFAQLGGEFGLAGGKSKSKTSSGASSETKTKPKGDWNAGIMLGYEHFCSSTIGAFGAIGFNYGKSKTNYEYRPSSGSGYDYTSTYSRFYIPVNLGIQVHFGEKEVSRYLKR